MSVVLSVLRQPGKSLSGLILCTLSVAILVVSGGQYGATLLTRANLEDRYDTLALASGEYLQIETENGASTYADLPEEYQEWVAEVIRTRSDLVKAESYTGGLSAYIPEMVPDNIFRHVEEIIPQDDKGSAGLPLDQEAYHEEAAKLLLKQYCDIQNPYQCAMFEITMTGVGAVPMEAFSFVERIAPSGEVEQSSIRESISLLCLGTIDRVIGLEQGYASPEGKTLFFLVQVLDEEEMEALQLAEGQRYLVYGMDYTDVPVENMSEELQEKLRELLGAELFEEGFAGRIDCGMTVRDYSSFPASGFDSSGAFTFLPDKRYLYSALPDMSNGVSAELIPAEEYISSYCVPTVARLEGTAEDYLASEEGFLWRQALEEMEISNHGFPVLAVEKLGYQAAFVRGQARIVEGRDFTEEERSGGSRVCILSQSLAETNGLKVGDTIDLRYYGYDWNIASQTENMGRTASPRAAVFSRREGFLTETEGYRIVGFYRQNNAWQNSEDPYGFTPNTIFVPKSSVTCKMMMKKAGVYYSLVLQNGKKYEFEQLQKEAGYPDLFICTDQGYSEIVSALEDYQSVSAGAFWIGIAVAVAVMALFLILFPLQQGKTVSLMNSLGAGRREKIRYILGCSACILIPGAVLGGICGGMAWKQVTAQLMESVSVAIPLEANTTVMAAVFAAVYSILALAASLAAAMALTREKGLKKRK